MGIHWAKESFCSSMDAYVSVTILRIIEDLGWPSLSCQRIKFFRLLNFWFMTTYDSIGFIVV